MNQAQPALQQAADNSTSPGNTGGVLMQAPPPVTLAHGLQLAADAYGWHARAEWLSGERDKNMLLHLNDGRKVVLKFINAAETAAETDVQVQVLDWLQHTACTVHTPQAIPTAAGACTAIFRIGNTDVRVRAYTFLEGISAAQTAITPTLQYSFGQTAAQMVQALAGFNHPALTQRVLLWDIMHVGQLVDWAKTILPDDDIKALALRFFPAFNSQVLPVLQAMPQQVIHSDLSRSNTVVAASDSQHIHGVLDFGDLTRAPRVVELAIAASYALDEQDPQPLAALARIVAGYAAILPLTPQEHHVLPQLVQARLLQRIVISEWRAAQFPQNSAYIMRSNAQARALIRQLALTGRSSAPAQWSIPT